jgi:Ca2+-binding RTX toxin-like protein
VRRFSLGLIAATAMLIAVPSGAGAATEIGDVFVPANGCGDDTTKLQSISPAGRYSAQSDGVITRWSFIAAATPPTDLRFKTARFTGTANEFTVTGESVLEADVIANELNSYFTRIPVLTGDIIGFFNISGGSGVRCLTDQAAGSGFTYHSFLADVGPGVTQTYSPVTDRKLDIAAILEPDCDKDGLGDETQDRDISSCGLQPLTCKGEQLTIVGTDGPDEIVGTPNRDVIGALGGNDNISGLDGDDVICAGEGNDTVTGGRGKDNVNGQSGNDRLNGSAARDTLKGKAGNDVLKGGAAKDVLKGGKGKDKLFGQGGSDKLAGGGGKDDCKGGGGGKDTGKSCEKQKGI